MTKEIWKSISEPGLESYEVSNLGRVRNKNGKILKQHILYGGYANCYLYKNGKIVIRRINRLVAFAFCNGYKEGFVANHIDHNRLNNHADNIEWCSQRENTNNESAYGFSLIFLLSLIATMRTSTRKQTGRSSSKCSELTWRTKNEQREEIHH